MNRNNTYSVWLSVEIEHEYYGTDKCPVTLIPDSQTQCFFHRNRMLYKRISPNKWNILSSGKEPEDTDFIRFEVKPLHHSFYYVSGNEPGSDSDITSFITSSQPGVWRILNIMLNQKEDVIKCNIPSREMYWECLLFPQKNSPETNYKISEQRGRLSFSRLERIRWKDESTIFRTVSVEKIKLKDIYPYILQLTDNQKGRERILYDKIPLPVPDSLSVTGSRETITTYIYL